MPLGDAALARKFGQLTRLYREAGCAQCHVVQRDRVFWADAGLSGAVDSLAR